jgi:hypothetical protein
MLSALPDPRRILNWNKLLVQKSGLCSLLQVKILTAGRTTLHLLFHFRNKANRSREKISSLELIKEE